MKFLCTLFFIGTIFATEEPKQETKEYKGPIHRFTGSSTKEWGKWALESTKNYSQEKKLQNAATALSEIANKAAKTEQNELFDTSNQKIEDATITALKNKEISLEPGTVRLISVDGAFFDIPLSNCPFQLIHTFEDNDTHDFFTPSEPIYNINAKFATARIISLLLQLYKDPSLNPFDFDEEELIQLIQTAHFLQDFSFLNEFFTHTVDQNGVILKSKTAPIITKLKKHPSVSKESYTWEILSTIERGLPQTNNITTIKHIKIKQVGINQLAPLLQALQQNPCLRSLEFEGKHETSTTIPGQTTLTLLTQFISQSPLLERLKISLYTDLRTCTNETISVIQNIPNSLKHFTLWGYSDGSLLTDTTFMGELSQKTNLESVELNMNYGRSSRPFTNNTSQHLLDSANNHLSTLVQALPNLTTLRVSIAGNHLIGGNQPNSPSLANLYSELAKKTTLKTLRLGGFLHSPSPSDWENILLNKNITTLELPPELLDSDPMSLALSHSTHLEEIYVLCNGGFATRFLQTMPQLKKIYFFTDFHKARLKMLANDIAGLQNLEYLYIEGRYMDNQAAWKYLAEKLPLSIRYLCIGSTNGSFDQSLLTRLQQMQNLESVILLDCYSNTEGKRSSASITEGLKNLPETVRHINFYGEMLRQ